MPWFLMLAAPADDKPPVGQPIEDVKDPAQEEEEEESVREAVGGALSGSLVGWGVSILMHAGLVLLASFLVWSYIEQVNEEEVIIPIARLSEMPGTPMTQTDMQRTQDSSASQRRSITRTNNPQSTIQSKVTATTQLIGLAGGASSKASPIGTAIGAGQDVGVGFFGTGGNAKRIVFVVDASGSLMDVLPFVYVELKKSIADLSEQQSFSVLFFRGGQVVESPPRGLQRATAEQKQRTIAWIDEVAREQGFGTSSTTPVAAIKQALTMRPQLLFILSDNITGRGIYELDQDELLAEIRRANRDNTKINTIQFIYPDPLDGIGGMKGTLRQIAEDTGGIYKYVPAEDLGLAVR